MLWACIWLPQLALDGVLRRLGKDERPLALITGPAQRRILLDANASARAAGLYPGQPLLAAQALLPDFLKVDHDPRSDGRLRRLLAAWAYRYSSMVSLEGDDAIVLEVEGSLGLFGPWPRLERMLRDDLQALGFQHRIAMAPTPLGACVLAATQDGLALTDTGHLRHALGRTPLSRARIAPEQATAMSAMGLRQLRQLFALPRDALARRFGPALLEHIDRLTGAHPDPRELYRPPDFFEERIELNYEVSYHPALLFPIRRLVNDLAAYLAGRDGGVQRFVIALEHEPHSGVDIEAVRQAGVLPDTEVVVGLLAAERDPARLFDLARSRLERTAIPAAVRALRLVARELPPFVPAGRDLFDERPAQAMPWEALRERLRARLGENALYQLAIHADPRPENALRRIAMHVGEPALQDNRTPSRPTWLLPRPMPLRDHHLEILAGPERIESGWWDGGDVRRDYYLVRTSLGQQAWAFRPAGASDDAWMLHGWFA